MNVGTGGHRNLNIASLQDTSTYKSNQQSMGVSVSAGMGKVSGSLNASRSSVDGNYASVNEQSGINAGDGGFQVKVNGNTDLIGGKIASTEKAAAEGKNSFITQTLTTSDIQNHSDYKAESQSAGVGTGYSGAKLSMNGTGVGIGSSSGSESSTTKSGITNLAGDTSVRSDKDSSGKITKNWDGQQLQSDVQAQAQITQMFGKESAKAIGTYATQQLNQLDDKIKVAKTDAEKAELIAERAKWEEGGAYRTALHTAAGALGGGMGGALGAATSSVAMPQIAKLIDGMDLPQTVKQGLAQVTATVLGGIVGGTSGLAAGVNVEANNRQLHQSERDWAKEKAKAYQQFLEKMTGEKVSAEEAYQRLLSAGYAMTNDAAQKAGRSDETAKQFIAQNKTGNLFNATAAERANPFLNGNKDGSWTPEQQARYGAKTPTEWVSKRLEQAAFVSGKPCTAAYECDTKVNNIKLALEALEQQKALYQDGASKKTAIERQQITLLSGMTAKEVELAKLAEADKFTLLDMLVIADAPALAGKLGQLIAKLSGRGAQLVEYKLVRGVDGGEDLAKVVDKADSAKGTRGINRPFREINPEFPPNAAVVEKMNSLKICSGTDCSEIAGILKEVAGGGRILRVTGASGVDLQLMEYGKIDSGFKYHEVFSDGKYVYDPRLSPAPVPLGDWTRMVQKLNPGALIK